MACLEQAKNFKNKIKLILSTRESMSREYPWLFLILVEEPGNKIKKSRDMNPACKSESVLQNFTGYPLSHIGTIHLNL